MSRMRSNAVVGERPKIPKGQFLGAHRLPPEPPPLPPVGKFPSANPRPLGVAFDTAIAKAVADRDALHPLYEVSFPTSQRLVYGPEYGASAGPKDFAWTTKFALKELARMLQVIVRISLTQTGVDTLGAVEKERVSAATQNLWHTHIASSWRGATLQVFNPTSMTVKELEVVFRVEFVEGVAGATGYDVSSQASKYPTPPPKPADVTTTSTSGAVRAAVAALNKKRADDQLADWQAEQKAKTRIAHPVHGTPHMLLWGRGDRAAIIHEFGHMLGLPDEYLTVRWNGQGVPASYAAAPFTTTSLMNNTDGNGGGRIEVRHYDTVRRAYEKWKGLAKDSTKVVLAGRNGTQGSPAGLG